MDTRLLQDAIDFYNQGNSMNSTAKQFHSTPGTLKKLFIQNNVYIRSQKEQLILENMKRAKKINHNFFNELNLKNSYYLGFLAADGTVRSNRNEIKIGLSSIDLQFLEQFQDDLESERSIHNYQTNNGFNVSELIFSSAKIKEDIGKYGIVPNKTYIGLNLNLIPQQYKLSYIKGFYDGDGSVVYNKNTNQVKLTFCSYTKTILEQINDYFGKIGYIYEKKSSKNIAYELDFSTMPSLNILKRFYEIDTPCLKRKYQKYLNILKLRQYYPRDRSSSDEDEKLC